MSRKLGFVAIAALVIATGLYAFGVVGGSGETHATALFPSAKGLYVGDDVRILGVRVGRVDAIRPEGTHVRVTFSVPSSQKVPAGAKAAIVNPSLVGSRYVQLAPAYSGGATLRDGSTIPLARTAVPLEFDDVKQQLTRLATTLAPTAQNPQGSLSQLIRVADRELGNGNADRLRTSLHGLSEAAQTLSSGKGDLFATIESLDSFLKNLVVNDASLRQFSSDLNSVSGTLSDDRASLALALDTLQQAFKAVERFVRTSRVPLAADVHGLADLSSSIAESTSDLEGVLHVVPTALSNFYNILDPRYDAFTGQLAVGGTMSTPFPQIMCGALAGVLGVTKTSDPASISKVGDMCRQDLAPLYGALGGSLQGMLHPGATPSTTTPQSQHAGGAATPGTGAQTGLGATLNNTVNGTVGSLLGLLLPGGTK